MSLLAIIKNMQYLFNNQNIKKTKKNGKNNQNQNPYLDRSAGQKVWNDRYLNLRQARQHWQYAFLVSSVMTFILLILVFKLSTQSHIKPFVVELNKGVPIGIAAVTGNLPDHEKLLQYAVTQFITNARTVLSDGDAEKLLLDKTYAFSAENTLGFLRDYYTRNNPFERAASCTVQVTILNSLKIGEHTWQITWDEIEKSQSGDAFINQSRYLATLTLQQMEPNPKYLNDNPFGIYITKLSWAKIQS